MRIAMQKTGFDPVDVGGLVVGTSALLVVIGAFLGWHSLPLDGTTSAADGLSLFDAASPVFNGLLTVGLATAAALLGLFLASRKVTNVATAVAGLAIELVALTVVVAPGAALGTSVDAGTAAPSSPGVGVFVTLVGGLGILLGSVASYRG